MYTYVPKKRLKGATFLKSFTFTLTAEGGSITVGIDTGEEGNGGDKWGEAGQIR